MRAIYKHKKARQSKTQPDFMRILNDLYDTEIRRASIQKAQQIVYSHEVPEIIILLLL